VTHFEPQRRILPDAQQALWPRLGELRTDFTLYGGTAIALRLGHRQSIDFDYFTDKPVDPDVALRDYLLLHDATILQRAPNSLVVTVPTAAGPVRLSLFGGLTFGRVGSPQWTSDDLVLVASPIDLLGHKLKVIQQRAESKDYRDIAALLAAGHNLAEGLGAASALYGNTFAPMEALRALTFFGDGDLPTLPQTVQDSLMQASGAVRGTLPIVGKISTRLNDLEPPHGPPGATR
jgi:hypothetical protein